jgi:hypothetical protein
VEWRAKPFGEGGEDLVHFNKLRPTLRWASKRWQIPKGIKGPLGKIVAPRGGRVAEESGLRRVEEENPCKRALEKAERAVPDEGPENRLRNGKSCKTATEKKSTKESENGKPAQTPNPASSEPRSLGKPSGAAKGRGPGKRCLECGTHKTRAWRKGPLGSSTLYHKCGSRYYNRMIRAGFQAGASKASLSDGQDEVAESAGRSGATGASEDAGPQALSTHSESASKASLEKDTGNGGTVRGGVKRGDVESAGHRAACRPKEAAESMGVAGLRDTLGSVKAGDEPGGGPRAAQAATVREDAKEGERSSAVRKRGEPRKGLSQGLMEWQSGSGHQCFEQSMRQFMENTTGKGEESLLMRNGPRLRNQPDSDGKGGIRTASAGEEPKDRTTTKRQAKAGGTPRGSSGGGRKRRVLETSTAGCDNPQNPAKRPKLQYSRGRGALSSGARIVGEALRRIRAGTCPRTDVLSEGATLKKERKQRAEARRKKRDRIRRLKAQLACFISEPGRRKGRVTRQGAAKGSTNVTNEKVLESVTGVKNTDGEESGGKTAEASAEGRLDRVGKRRAAETEGPAETSLVKSVTRKRTRSAGHDGEDKTKDGEMGAEEQSAQVKVGFGQAGKNLKTEGGAGSAREEEIVLEEEEAERVSNVGSGSNSELGLGLGLGKGQSKRVLRGPKRPKQKVFGRPDVVDLDVDMLLVGEESESPKSVRARAERDLGEVKRRLSTVKEPWKGDERPGEEWGFEEMERDSEDVKRRLSAVKNLEKVDEQQERSREMGGERSRSQGENTPGESEGAFEEVKRRLSAVDGVKGAETFGEKGVERSGLQGERTPGESERVSEKVRRRLSAVEEQGNGVDRNETNQEGGCAVSRSQHDKTPSKDQRQLQSETAAPEVSSFVEEPVSFLEKSEALSAAREQILRWEEVSLDEIRGLFLMVNTWSPIEEALEDPLSWYRERIEALAFRGDRFLKEGSGENAGAFRKWIRVEEDGTVGVDGVKGAEGVEKMVSGGVRGPVKEGAEAGGQSEVRPAVSGLVRDGAQETRTQAVGRTRVPEKVRASLSTC